jgi:hypothetical protein
LLSSIHPYAASTPVEGAASNRVQIYPFLALVTQRTRTSSRLAEAPAGPSESFHLFAVFGPSRPVPAVAPCRLAN